MILFIWLHLILSCSTAPIRDSEGELIVEEDSYKAVTELHFKKPREVRVVKQKRKNTIHEIHPNNL